MATACRATSGAIVQETHMTLARVTAALLSSATVLASFSPALAAPSAELIAAAQAEGQLNVIALPRDWCGYGALIDGFAAMYGIRVNELNPNAGSGDELEAIRANRGNTGPQAPDVIDIGLSFGPIAQEEGLITPYKVETWDTIPDSAKQADGYWYGDYYGVLAFAVNTDLIPNAPADWADLLDPQYRGAVALAGDPRVSNQAIQGVFAAGLSRAEGDVAGAGQVGLDFFAELNAAGNFVPVIGSVASLAQGTTPILITWDYLALAGRDTLNGNPPVEIVVPTTGVVAGVYVQAISAYAPNPNAAKLWMEYLYSDEGQLGWLAGYCHPIRFNDLVARGVIPQDLMDALPPAEAYVDALFPTLDEQGVYRQTITTGWDGVVRANVVAP